MPHHCWPMPEQTKARRPCGFAVPLTMPSWRLPAVNPSRSAMAASPVAGGNDHCARHDGCGPAPVLRQYRQDRHRHRCRMQANRANRAAPSIRAGFDRAESARTVAPCPAVSRASSRASSFAGTGARPTTTWALVPPKPKELTPAKRCPVRARRPVLQSGRHAHPQILKGNFGVRRFEIEIGRDAAVMLHQRDLDQAGDARRRFRMAEIGFD